MIVCHLLQEYYNTKNIACRKKKNHGSFTNGICFSQILGLNLQKKWFQRNTATVKVNISSSNNLHTIIARNDSAVPTSSKSKFDRKFEKIKRKEERGGD